MNKKILAILMALLMVAMSTVAMAAEAATVEVFKKYSTNATLPTEDLTFTATCTAFEGADGSTEIPANTPSFSKVVNTNELTVNTETAFEMVASGDFPAAGIYTYVASEEGQSLQGATYDETTVTFEVLVSYAENSTDLVVEATGVAKLDGKTKDGLFENVYNEGGLTLTKTVTGNAGNIDDTFEVTLTFTAEDGKSFDDTFTSIKVGNNEVALTDNTAVFSVKHGDTLAITGIPYDTNVTIVETDELVGGGEHQYKVTYKVDEAEVEEVSIDIDAANTATVALTNTRTTSIDTGVNTDSMPYFMLMAFVMILAAAVVLKKRTVNE